MYPSHIYIYICDVPITGTSQGIWYALHPPIRARQKTANIMDPMALHRVYRLVNIRHVI